MKNLKFYGIAIQKWVFLFVIFSFLSVKTANSQVLSENCNLSTAVSTSNFTTITQSENLASGTFCSGALVNPAFIIDPDESNFSVLSITGLNCTSSINVKDNNDTYPVGTYAGFRIDASGILAVNVGAKITVALLSGGTEVESKIVVSSSLDVNALLLGPNNTVDLGFISTVAFDEIQISFETLLGSYTTNIYHALIKSFCDGADLSCNTQEEINNPEYPANINEDRTGISGVLCALCTISGTQNVVSSSETDFATIELVAAGGTNASISVESVDQGYTAGHFAGFEISNPGLIGSNILSGITIETYSNGILQETTSNVNTEIISASSGLLNGPNRQRVGLITAQGFDEVRLTLNNLLGVSSTTNIYSLIVQEFCSGPSLDCNSLVDVSVPDFPLYINNTRTGFVNTVCAGCTIDKAESVITSTKNDSAKIDIVAGVLSTASIAVKDALDTYDGGSFVGFEIRNSTLLDAEIFNNISICTYLDGVQQECISGGANLISTVSSLLVDEGKRTIGFITDSNLDFDEVQINLFNILNVDLGTTYVYDAIISPLCEKFIECDSSYVLVNQDFPVIINSGRSGINGLVCGSSSIIGQQNVINSNPNDFAKVIVGLGVDCTASLSVQDAVSEYPLGSTAGFTIEVTDTDLINLGLNLFESIEICTYLDGTQQECKTGSELLDLELLIVFINDNDGVYNVGFRSSTVYDEIQINISSLASLVNVVDIYAAFVDTRGATGAEFFCCPILAPELSETAVTNACPTKVFNLNSLITSTTPVNSVVQWYDNSTHMGSQISNPIMIGTGTYFAFYYDSVSDCYSPASEQVNVTILDCADLVIDIAVDEPAPFYTEQVVFTISTNNLGVEDATLVSVDALIPDGYSFVSAETTSGSYDENSGTWTIGTVTVGSKDTLELTLVANSTGDYVFDVSIDGLVNDIDLSNNMAMISTAPIDPCTPSGQSVDIDCDLDGLTNNEELTGVDDINTPANPMSVMTDPNDPDTDGDGVLDGTEFIDGTNPLIPCDFNPASVTETPDVDFLALDCDGDGVTNLNESTDNTDLMNPCEFVRSSVTMNATSITDCDGDGVLNMDEINGLDNNFITTSDSTGLLDFCDYNVADQNSTPSPAWNAFDCDGDGVTNADELTDSTNPLDECNLLLTSVTMNATSQGDCDGDGVKNADEINGIDNDFSEEDDNTDPNDPCSFNFLDVSLAVTANQSACNSLVAKIDINVTQSGIAVSGSILDNDMDPEGHTFSLNSAKNESGGVITTNGVLNILPNGSSLKLKADGTYIFTPAPALSQTTSFEYTICDDGIPSVCVSTKVYIYLARQPILGNNPPIAANDAGQITNDEILMGNLLANDDDIDNDILTANVTPVSGPSNGTITIGANGDFTYDPNDTFEGTDMVTYEVCDDGSPSKCEEATLFINVTDPIIANEIYANDDLGLGYKNRTQQLLILSNDTDHEGDNFMNPEIISQVQNGTLTMNPDNSVMYQPNTDYTGNDQFTYEVCDDGSPSVCDTATVYLSVLDAICFDVQIRVYLEGALRDNGNAIGANNEPLMRDDLRSNTYPDTLGANFIPVLEPYSDLDGFTHVGGGGGEVATPQAFIDRGQNSVVDWVFIELRSKLNGSQVVRTRSALLQRDGDVVEVDGISTLQVCGVTDAQYFVAIRHRNHLGVMTESIENLSVNGVMIDFTNKNSSLSGIFNYGTNHPEAPTLNFTGLTMNALLGVDALWAGNANGDDKIKFQAPGDDVFQIIVDVLLHPDNASSDFNFAKGYGYYGGDTNMDGIVKLQAPDDDTFNIFRQLLLFDLNISTDFNFNSFLEQLK